MTFLQKKGHQAIKTNFDLLLKQQTKKRERQSKICKMQFMETPVITTAYAVHCPFCRWEKERRKWRTADLAELR